MRGLSISVTCCMAALCCGGHVRAEQEEEDCQAAGRMWDEAAELESHGDHVAAGELFVQLYQNHRHGCGPKAIDALLRAARVFYPIGKVGASIQIWLVARAELWDEPSSAQTLEALDGLAKGYRDVAFYSKAAHYLHERARKAPYAKGAAEALLEAIVYRAGLGQHDVVHRHGTSALSWYLDSPEHCGKAAQVAVQAARPLLEEGASEHVIKLLQPVFSTQCTETHPVDRIESESLLGRALCHGDRSHKLGRKLLGQASKAQVHIDLSPERAHQLAGAQGYGALALANLSFAELSSRKLVPRPPAKAGVMAQDYWMRHKLSPWVDAGSRSLAKGLDLYLSAASHKLPMVQVEALARLGKMYETVYRELAKTDALPPHLVSYRKTLKGEVLDSYADCRALAQEKRVLSRWTRICEQGFHDLDGSVPRDDEIAAQPRFLQKTEPAEPAPLQEIVDPPSKKRQ